MSRKIREKGQVLVTTALIMFVALGFLALIFDAGIAYASRRQQQNAADSAAMAGTRLIALGSTTDAAVAAEVGHYIGENNPNPPAPSFTANYIDVNRNVVGVVGGGWVPGNAAGVLVVSNVTNTGFFSQLIGQPTYTVGAPAAAVAQPAGLPASIGDLMPLAIPLAAWEGNDPADPSMVLAWGAHYHSTYAGGYGLNFPADFKGVAELPQTPGCPENATPQRARCQIDNGYNGPLSEYIPYNNGQYGANIRDRLQNRVDQGGGQAIVYVLVFDNNPLNHNGDLHVVGVAGILVRDGDITANSASGEFVSYISPPGIPPGTDLGIPWQPKTVRLVPVEPGAVPTAVPTPTPDTTPPTPTPTVPAGPTSTPTPPAAATPTPTATACPAPTFVSGPTAARSGNQVTVSWTVSAPAAGTLSWTGTNHQGNPVSDSMPVAAATTHSISTGLHRNGTYTFTVNLSNACGSLSGSATHN